MESKPIHYDGSTQYTEASIEDHSNESFVLTDEMRTNISGNPYTYNNK